MSRTIRRALTVAAVTLAVITAPAAAASRSSSLDRTFPAASFDEVLVDVSFHDVVVVPGAGDRIRVRVDLEFQGSTGKVERLLADYQPRLIEEGRRLIVRSTAPKVGWGGWSWGSDQRTGRVRLEVPAGLDVTVDAASGECRFEGDFGDAALVGDTASGDVVLVGAAGSLRGDTASGGVRAELHRALPLLVADTASGSVEVAGPVVELRADTASGEVEADGLLGDAVADTASGSVTLRWTAIPPRATVRVDTASGSVRLTFPHGSELDGAIDTSSGDIFSDAQGLRSDRGRRLDVRGGSGAIRLAVDTASGDVRLRLE